MHVSDLRDRVLGQRVARAGDDAGRVLAGAAGDGRDQHLVHAHRADATAVDVKVPVLGVRAGVLAQLTTHALFRVAGDVSVFRS